MPTVLMPPNERTGRASAARPQPEVGIAELTHDWASAEIEMAWDSEIRQRIADCESGRAILVPAADVFAQARLLTQ
jgi:hypothetical protein